MYYSVLATSRCNCCNLLKGVFYMCQKLLEFQVAQHEGESSNGPVEVRGWELTLSASLSLGLLLRWVSYWRALTAQSPDDCHLYPQWDVSSGPWKKDQADAVRASRTSIGAEVGGSLILIPCCSWLCSYGMHCGEHLVRWWGRGHWQETTLSWDLMGKASWDFRVHE